MKLEVWHIVFYHTRDGKLVKGETRLYRSRKMFEKWWSKFVLAYDGERMRRIYGDEFFKDNPYEFRLEGFNEHGKIERTYYLKLE